MDSKLKVLDKILELLDKEFPNLTNIVMSDVDNPESIIFCSEKYLDAHIGEIEEELDLTESEKLELKSMTRTPTKH